MPAVSLDAADAAELAELVRFVGDWLAADPDRLGICLQQFVGSGGYEVARLRGDLDRFAFLLGGDDGRGLFGDSDTGGVDQPLQTRGGGVPAEGLAGPIVELGGHGGQAVGVVYTQVGALGEVLPQQPVGVLVARPLPRTCLLTEEHRHPQPVADLAVEGHLLALVPGQGTPQPRRQLAERGHQGVGDGLGGVPARQIQQDREPTRPVHQGADRRPVRLPGDQVPLPVPRHAARRVPGHWEGDLITGEANRSAIGTLVDRASRLTILVYLPGRHTAEAVTDALVAAFSQLPARLRRSLTWDQGKEMALHRQISDRLGMPDWTQPVVATPACWSKNMCWSRASAGVRQSRVLRGRVLSA